MFKSSIVGCGGIGDVHANVICKSDKTEFLSCCDEKPERAAEFTKMFGGKPYPNLKALLEAEKPDILHICTGHYSHVPLALYALKNGVNVILEKPAASSPEAMEILVKHAALADKQIGICFQNRYNQSSQTAYKLINSGKAGKVLSGRGIVTWFRNEKYYTGNDWRGATNTEGGGVTINQSIHTLDLLQWLMGDPVTIESTRANRSLKGVINVEDTAEAFFTYPNGSHGIFYATTAYGANSTILLEIVCENMTITVDGMKLKITYPDGRVEEPEMNNDNENFGKNYWGNGHAALIGDFYSALEEGRRFLIDAKEGCRILKTLFKMFESNQKRSVIKF